MGASKRAFEEQRELENAMKENEFFARRESGMILRIPSVDINKEALNTEINQMVESVKNGDVDPIKVVAYFSAMDKMIKAVRSAIMDDAVDEFAKYGEKAITVLGNCEISQVEAGVRNDFSNTPAWVEIKERENEIANERKELEATLKTLKKPGMISIDDEIVEANPPIRTSTTTVKVVIK